MPGGLLSQLLVLMLVLLPFRRCRRRRAGIRRFLAKGFGWPVWLLALAAGVILGVPAGWGVLGFKLCDELRRLNGRGDSAGFSPVVSLASGKFLLGHQR
jgi:hypothetical protein